MRRHGFTLIEILMVVIIMGIAAAMIVPQMTTASDLRAAAAARTVMSDMIYAQNLSVTSQAKHYVRFDNVGESDTSYGLYAALSASPTAIINPVTNMAYLNRLGPSGVAGMTDSTLSAISFNGKPNLTAVVFDALGSPSVCDATGLNEEPLASGTIDVTSGTVTMRISLQPFTGEIDVARINNP